MTIEKAIKVFEDWWRLCYHNDDGTDPCSHELKIAIETVLPVLHAQQAAESSSSILKAALAKYGPDTQTLMTFEEMAELQKELCKHARGADNVDHIAEEIADVQIMLEQMIILHDCRQGVEKRRAARCHCWRGYLLIEGAMPMAARPNNPYREGSLIHNLMEGALERKKGGE